MGFPLWCLFGCVALGLDFFWYREALVRALDDQRRPIALLTWIVVYVLFGPIALAGTIAFRIRKGE